MIKSGLQKQKTMLANLQHAGRVEQIDKAIDQSAVVQHNKDQVAQQIKAT